MVTQFWYLTWSKCVKMKYTYLVKLYVLSASNKEIKKNSRKKPVRSRGTVLAHVDEQKMMRMNSNDVRLTRIIISSRYSSLYTMAGPQN